MALITIGYGEILSSSDLNDNFTYLDGRVTDSAATLQGNIDSLGNTISSQGSTISTIQSTLSGKANDYVPTGTVIWYAKNAVPTGYLLCNGSAVSRTDFADLFAVIGTTYGAGDGSTTFNLPYLISRFIEGGTPGYYFEPGLPNITGTIANNGLSHSGWAQGAFSADNSRGVKSNRGDAEDGGYYNFNAGWSNGIYGNSSTVQPEALGMLPCIKY